MEVWRFRAWRLTDRRGQCCRPRVPAFQQAGLTELAGLTSEVWGPLKVRESSLAGFEKAWGTVAPQAELMQMGLGGKVGWRVRIEMMTVQVSLCR